MNPVGRVPVLEEDGWVLPESAVINEYLEERYPEPPLLPADPGGAGGGAAAHLPLRRLHAPLLRPRRGRRERRSSSPRRSPRSMRRSRERPYLTGEAFGLADVAYVPVGDPRARPARGLAEPYPHVDAWLAALAERPSVAAEIALVAGLALMSDVTRDELERRLGEEGLVVLDVRIGGRVQRRRPAIRATRGRATSPGARHVDLQELLAAPATRRRSGRSSARPREPR